MNVRRIYSALLLATACVSLLAPFQLFAANHNPVVDGGSPAQANVTLSNPSAAILADGKIRATVTIVVDGDEQALVNGPLTLTVRSGTRTGTATISASGEQEVTLEATGCNCQVNFTLTGMTSGGTETAGPVTATSQSNDSTPGIAGGGGDEKGGGGGGGDAKGGGGSGGDEKGGAGGGGNDEKNGGPEASFGLGTSEKGEASAGKMDYSFDKPTSEMYQPEGLKVRADTAAATVIREPGYTGSAAIAPVRQVLSARQLTDIVPLTADSYEIRSYPVSAVGSLGSSGLHQVTGSPLKKTTIENPGAITITNTSDQPLYHQQRWAKSFAYAIPMTNSKYQVQLHFADLYNDQAGKAAFNVSAEGAVKLANFDPYAAAGARYKATVQNIETTVLDGTLNLAFAAVKQGANVSAIKVVRAAAASITGTADPDLYQSERHGNFSYQLSLPNGDYEVILSFIETTYTAAAQRKFDVTVEGALALNDYDIYTQAGGANKTRQETIPVTLADGQLNLQFTSVTDEARVAAIAIRSVATSTIVAAVNAGGSASYTATDGTVYVADAGFIGGAADYPGRLVAAINAGGQTYTATDGTVYVADSAFTGGVSYAGALNRLKITIEEAGGSPKVYDYTWVANPVTSNFDETILVHPSGLKQEGHQQIWSSDGQTYQEIRTVRDASGTLVSKVVSHYENFLFGFRRVSEVVDPDGAALTRTWTYIEGSANPADPKPLGYSLVKRYTSPTGYWEEYSYDADAQVTKTVSRYLNSTTYAEADNKVETTAYAITNPVRTYITTIKGQKVSRSYEAETDDTASHEYERRTLTAVTPGAAWTATDNLVSTSRAYTSAHPTALLRGQTKWTERPDGVRTFFSYASGTRTVTADTGAPNTGLTAIIDGTRTITVNNPAGQTISEDMIDIASGLTLSSWSALTVDSLGRPTLIGYGDGTIRSTTYVGSSASCGTCSGAGNFLIESETDRNGVTTSYTYDALNRRTETTRLGVTDKVVYDAAGRIVERLRIGTSGPAISQQKTTYDLAGRVTATEDALGNVTAIAYSYPTGGGLITTTTYPATVAGSGTRIETTYADGHTKEISGTAVSPVKYAYGTHSIGEWTQQIKVGDASSETEWTKTYSDLVGRQTKVEYADAAQATMTYNALGQLEKQTDLDGVQTLFAYNTKGEREITALDLNRDGVIDYAGTDRVTKSVRDVYSKSGTIVSRATTQVWATDSTNTATTVSVTEQDGYGNQSWQKDAATAESSTIIARTAPGAWTVTASALDGSQQVQTYTGGRLASTTRKNSSGGQVGKTDYAYDAHNRVSSQTDARTGAVAYTYSARDQVLTTIANNNTETTTHTYDALGNPLTVTRPDNSVTTHTYHLRNNQLKKTSGSQTYPVEYTYDLQGRMKTLTTWQNATSATGAAVTTWNYDSQRGWLTQKLYDDNTGPSYTYKPSGRLLTRTWARTVSSSPLVTTYAYNNAGDLASTDYSDTTPDVVISYTRFGAQQTVTDATGERAYTYVPGTLRPYKEQLPSFYGDRILTRSYQVGLDLGSTPPSVPGRNNGFTLGVSGNLNSDYAVTYGYDSAGRLSTLTDLNGLFTYGYLANSSLRETIMGPVHTATTTYEPHRNVLDTFENKVGATTVSKFDYTVNNLGQRTARANSGTAFGIVSTDAFAYNAKGEVESATNTTLTARDQSFVYDDIGNRLTFTTTRSTTSYTANSLNAYTAIGAASPTHDEDGNQTSTGTGQTYIWDAENRLIAIEPVLPTTGDKKQLNAYDAQSRRVRKQVFTYTSGTWSLTTDEKFIYDGWNLIAVLDAASSNALLRTYSWGTDLSGSLQGAGGVGGLLSAKDGSVVYHYTYDANGNVSEVLNNSGGIAAHYEYDAFGNTVASSGAYAMANAYRFSTKPLDSATELYYYGLRYYNPNTGRWPSRDPIGERGGINLYGMVNNNAVNKWDYLGRFVGDYSSEKNMGIDEGPPYRSINAGSDPIPVECPLDVMLSPSLGSNPIDFCLRKRLCRYTCRRSPVYRPRQNYIAQSPAPEVDNPLDRYEPEPPRTANFEGLSFSIDNHPVIIKVIRVMSDSKTGCEAVIIFESGMNERFHPMEYSPSGGARRG